MAGRYRESLGLIASAVRCDERGGGPAPDEVQHYRVVLDHQHLDKWR